MKNTKFIKAIVLALTLVALASVAAIAVGAQASEETSVNIIRKNVSYDSEITVMFAVDHTNAGENAEIEILYYFEDPTVNPEAKSYLGETYETGYTDTNGTEDTADDITYPAFYTAGFPLARICENVYAKAHIAGTEIYSPVVRYSVAEYLNKRLYVDDTTELQDNFYSSLLDSADYLQTILNSDTNENNNVENTLADMAYVYIDGEATLDGKYGSGMYALNSSVTPTSTDGSVDLWSVKTTTAEGVETSAVKDGETFAVNGRTIITPDKSTITFDDCSDISDIEGATLSHANGGNAFKITEVEEGNKALTIDTANTGATRGLTSAVFEMNNTVTDADAVLLKFDFYVSATDTSRSNWTIQMRDAAGVKIVELSINEKFTLCYTNGNGDVGTTSATLSTNTWMTLRVEYLDLGDTMGLKVYLGEDCVLNLSNYSITSVSPESRDISAIANFRIHTYSDAAIAHFDNLVFKQEKTENN